jgi:hypothetical protein
MKADSSRGPQFNLHGRFGDQFGEKPQIVEQGEFLTQLVAEYYKARNPLFPCEGKLYRGGNRSISAVAEDWLAFLIAKHSPSDFQVYVNQHFSWSMGGGPLSITPDIAICRVGRLQKKIRLLIDLKMDLGFARKEFIPQAIAKNAQIRSLRNQKVTFRLKRNVGSGHGKDIQDARVSNDVQYLYVVVCDKNCPAPQYAEIKKEVNRLPFVKLITLVSGVHLNGYESKCRDESSRGQWLQQEEAAALVLGHASRSDFITLNAWLRRSFTP